MGPIKRDTRSLDYSSTTPNYLSMKLRGTSARGSKGRVVGQPMKVTGVSKGRRWAKGPYCRLHNVEGLGS